MKRQDQFPQNHPQPLLPIGLMQAGITVVASLVAGAILIAMMAGVLCSLTGCSAKPQPKVTLTAIEVSADVEEAVLNELYQKSHAMPEVLATTMSAFSTLAKECGLRDVDAQSIDQELSCALDGGEVQARLLEQLLQLLRDPETEITFYNCTGAVTRQVPLIPEDGDLNPITVEVVDTEAELDEDLIVAVKVTYDDGATEIGYYDTTYNYARLIFDEADAQIDESRQQVNTMDQGALAAIAQGMMTNILT